VVAGALFFFVWIPFWAWHNWDDLAKNRSETFATMIVALLFLTILQVGLWWDGSMIRSELRMSFIKTDYSWLLTVFDNVTRILGYGTIFSWSYIRNRISALLDQIS